MSYIFVGFRVPGLKAVPTTLQGEEHAPVQPFELYGETEFIPQPSGETEPAPKASGETEFIPRPSGETEPAPKASGETETNPEPSGKAELSQKASGEVEPNSYHSNKGRNGALIRLEVFNIRWLSVPPSGVPRY